MPASLRRRVYPRYRRNTRVSVVLRASRIRMDETGRIKVSGFAAALRFTIVDATERITRQRAAYACLQPRRSHPVEGRGGGPVIIAGCNLRGGIITRRAFKRGIRASPHERGSPFAPHPKRTSGINRNYHHLPGESLRRIARQTFSLDDGGKTASNPAAPTNYRRGSSRELSIARFYFWKVVPSASL